MYELGKQGNRAGTKEIRVGEKQMSVELRTKGFRASEKYISDLVADLEGDLQQALLILADDIIQEARSNLQNDAHVYTGELNSSIQVLESGSNFVTVGSLLPYAGYIEYGRGPVRPINAKFLHYFTKDGKEIFSKYSKATDPSPFLEPAVISKSNMFKDIVVEQTYHSEPVTGNDQ